MTMGWMTVSYTHLEVPSAMNLQECWDLINLSESTRKHCFRFMAEGTSIATFFPFSNAHLATAVSYTHLWGWHRKAWEY